MTKTDREWVKQLADIGKTHQTISAAAACLKAPCGHGAGRTPRVGYATRHGALTGATQLHFATGEKEA